MISTWPTRIKLALVILFKFMSRSVVVPNLAAIPLRESPATTVYLVVPPLTGAVVTGATEILLILRTCPGKIEFSLVRLFNFISRCVVLPNRAAIPRRVSPWTTV